MTDSASDAWSGIAAGRPFFKRNRHAAGGITDELLSYCSQIKTSYKREAIPDGEFPERSI